MTDLAFSPSSLPGADDITRKVFANGSTLITRSNFSSPAVVFRGYLPPGAIAEPADKIGLASFTASMLMAGTRRLDFRSLHDRIESMGASLGIGSGGLHMSFSGQCLKEDLPALLALLKEILAEPAFPEKQFKRIKAQILTFQAIQAQDTAEMADQAFDRLFYGAHPYAHPDLGYAHTVQSISREDITAFHQQYLGPQGLIMAISGGISASEVTQAFAETIGVWQKPEQVAQPELPAFTPVSTSMREHIALEEKTQTNLLIGTLAPETTGPYYHACLLGNNIFGQFGMMGRIGEVVREKAGLAYTVQSAVGKGLGPTAWQIAAGVNPENLEKAIALLMQELKRFTSEPVSAEELDDARSQTIGHLPLTMESNAGICQALLNIERFSLDVNYYRQLPELLKSITPDEILNAAQRYWNLDRLVITSAGRALG